MTSELTIVRLQEAADILQMLEGALATGTINRSMVAGLKATLRHAREAITQSTLELKHRRLSGTIVSTSIEEKADALASTAGTSPEQQDIARNQQSGSPPEGPQSNLRASIEKIIERI